MNASEILELVRAGYTRAEIDAMNADPEPAHDEPSPGPTHDEPSPGPTHDEPNPEPAHDEPNPEPEEIPAWAQTLNKTLDDLRKTIQASNIRGDDMGDELDTIDAAELAAAKYLTGKEPEVIKSKGGTKRK